VTVLALLLSLLLGYAPAAASTAEPDRSALRLGKSDAAKSGAVLRSGSRLQSDDQEGDQLLAAVPPRPVASSICQHPAAEPAARDPGEVCPGRTHAYRARAPPAA
jgi:hypothetical protein